MTNGLMSELESLAKKEAGVWVGSRYYEDAERWMHKFWSEDSVFLKLFRKLDRSYLVDLACGHGRHSEHVLNHFDSGLRTLICLDILADNIDFCSRRLKGQKKVSFVQNDGISFRPIEPISATAIFCYDAMVHFDREVIRSYIKDAERILIPGGRALLHHSNYDKKPSSVFSQNPHARAFMSTDIFKGLVEDAGLRVLEQTPISWGGELNLDCVTLVEKPRHSIYNRVMEKIGFGKSVQKVSRAIRLGVCTCVRNERPYLREWVSHYRTLGFDAIYIYNNESNDASKELLSRLVGPDLYVIPWATPPNRSPQLSAFENCAATVAEACDFLAFFDIDEFLIEGQSGELRRTLSSLPGSTEGVLVNQRIVGANGQKTYSPLPITERFPATTSEDYQENVWVKSIVRPRSIQRFHNPHIPLTKDSRFASGAGVQLDSNDVDRNGRLSFVDHKVLALNHYILRSYEEFLWKKCRGGGAAATREARMRRYESDDFFLRRKMTIERREAAPRQQRLSSEQQARQFASAVDDLRQFPVAWTVNRGILSPSQRDWVLQQMLSHDALIDYGASEAVIDAVYAGMRRIVSVHSSPTVMERMNGNPVLAAAHKVGRLNIVHADIGSVDDFGYPTDQSKSPLFKAYPDSGWRSLKNGPKHEQPPLVVITGRFRVACTCYSALMSPASKILLRDYADRPQYKPVERLFEINQLIDGAAVLSLKQEAETEIIREVLERFALTSL